APNSQRAAQASCRTPPLTPSAHSASAAAFYMTLGLLAASWVRRWETRVYVLLAAVFVVAMVGFSRLYLGVHYLSDVLAGYALGAFWATLAITAGMVLDRSLPSRSSTPEAHGMTDHSHPNDGEVAPTPSGDSATGHPHSGGKVFSPKRAGVLDDERRLLHLSEDDLRRLLALRGDEDVADLGSGTGFYANRVAGWTSGSVYAVELQAEMQDLHRRKGAPANVELVLADADQLPLPVGSIDRALSVNTFHEAHGAEGLRRLAAALRPGGLFVIVDWRRAGDALEQGPPLEHRLSTDEVRSLLEPWFEVVSEDVVSTPFFAVVARKR
ncbi:MAG TPA: phosphatase PAP2 family protein, partial [Thermoleophilia bacterium]|nr:phosphatase PAP2 family protein [Thermoleophilia bacterium]